jgi:hypothetical protein
MSASLVGTCREISKKVRAMQDCTGRPIQALLLISLAGLAISCGFSTSPTAKPSQASLAIFPSSTTVASEGTQQFSLAIRNLGHSKVIWTATGGSVSSSGFFSAPAVSSSATVKVTAASSDDSTVRAVAVVNISPPGAMTPPLPLSIAPATLLPATAGQSYSATFSASGGQPPYQWALVGGTCPAGLQLAPGSGLLSGTPSNAGDFTLEIEVKDASGQQMAQSFPLPVNAATTTPPPPPTLAIETSALAAATAGKSYSATLAASGGQPPYHWTLGAGSFPAGLQLSGTTGQLGGTTNSSGNFTFTIAVSDNSSQNASRSFTLAVNSATSTPPPPHLAIVTSTLPAATATKSYSATFAASGGEAPYTWAVAGGTLPTGLQLTSASGLFAGTTNTAGDYTFDLEVKDASGQDVTQGFTLTVNPANEPAVIPASFFGMHMAIYNTSLGNPAPWGTPIVKPLVIGSMGKCVTSNWSYVEHTPGEYYWKRMDTCTEWAAHYGIKYFQSAQFMTPASIGAVYPATDPRCWPASLPGIYYCQGTMTAQGEQDWINYNAAMARRYKGNAGMDFYEGWNEPPYAGRSSAMPIPAAQLAQYERDRVSAIRTNDPAAKIASPAFVIDPKYPGYAAYLDDFLTDHPPTYDYYDFHMNYQNAPEDEIPMIAQFKQILAKHGIASPTIFATEAGRGGSGIEASLDTCPRWPARVTPELQQAFVGRMELLYWSQGVARHYWYAYDVCGTITNQPYSNTLTPGGVAYSSVESWMIGASMDKLCAGPDSGTGVWTCGLTRPDGTRTLAVWDSSQSCEAGNCTTSTYTYDPIYTKYYTLAGGNATPLTGGTVQVGAKPILLSQ